MRNSTAITALLVLLLSACSTATYEPHYYTLGSNNLNDEENKTIQPTFYIGVGPVSIPEIVNRPQIVLENGANQVAIADQHRWAQPLKQEISRVIVASLSQQLDGAWVTDSRQSTRNLDYRITVDIQRFDAKFGKTVGLEALWTVYPAKKDKVYSGKAMIQEKIEGDSYEALVAAHERAIITMSRDIAATIRNTSPLSNNNNS